MISEFISPVKPVGAVNPPSPTLDSSSSVNHLVESCWLVVSSSLSPQLTKPKQVTPKVMAQAIIDSIFLNMLLIASNLIIKYFTRGYLPKQLLKSNIVDIEQLSDSFIYNFFGVD